VQPLPSPPHAYVFPRLSPDGQRLAVGIPGASSGVWLYELARGTLTRLAENRSCSRSHLDAGRQACNSFRTREERLREPPFDAADGSAPRSASPRAKTFRSRVLGLRRPSARLLELIRRPDFDLWVLRLEGGRRVQPFSKRRLTKLRQCSRPTDTGLRTYPTNQAERDVRATLSRPWREVADFN